MTSVILAANPKDRQLWERFSQVLDTHFATICSYGGHLKTSDLSAEFVITDTKSYQNITTECACIVFKDIRQFDMELITQNPVTAIVDSCNKKLLPFVSSTKLTAITCGLSSTDTVTLSSIGEDSAVINLQRSILCLDGTVAEPQEIPVRFQRPIDSFDLMAIASVFILSGNVQKLMMIANLDERTRKQNYAAVPEEPDKNYHS